MGRQGKMHGSPFHVENQFYKYAVEHESGCDFQSVKPQCEYYSSGAGICKKWNAYHGQRCRYFECRLHKKESQRKFSCTACAYFYSKKCFNSKCPINERKNNDAPFYRYFLNEKTNPQKYTLVKTKIEYLSLTAEKKALEDGIKSKKKYIRKSLATLTPLNENPEMHNQQMYRINDKRSQANQQENRLSQICDKIKQLEIDLKKLQTK